MKEEDILRWIDENICDDFEDYEITETYLMLNELNEELLGKIMNATSYKLLLKYNNLMKPNFVDRETILDNLKDIILVGGSSDYTIDDYMDWDGFVQEEIDWHYVKYGGEYVLYDELEEYFRNIVAKCVL